MRLFIALFFTGLTAFFIFKASNAATAKNIQNTKNPLVVELFTSQSCSSCPPADKLLGKLAENNNVIALTEEIKLTLFSYGDKHTQSIPSGENKGRTVSYTNPVTNIESVKMWDGSEQNISLPYNKKDAGYALIAHQNNGYGKIIAAGKINF